MAAEDDNRFVIDGYERAQAAISDDERAVIRAEVMRQFADRLRSARGLRRWLLTRKVEREVQRRLDAKAPPDALYVAAAPDAR